MSHAGTVRYLRRALNSWRVVCYEQEGEAYLLQLSAILQDDSRLEARDYLFADGSRKYSYQWMMADGTLRRRWDNAPHWPDVAAFPHHVHLPDQETLEASSDSQDRRQVHGFMVERVNDPKLGELARCYYQRLGVTA